MIRQVVNVALVTNNVHIEFVAQGILHVTIYDAEGGGRVKGLMTARGWYSDADLYFTPSATTGETDHTTFGTTHHSNHDQRIN